MEDRGALLIGAVFVLAAAAIPACQALVWLKTGVWPPLPISSALHYIGWAVPATEWVGLQKLIDWIFYLPVFLIPAFLAFGALSTWKDSR